ncbi:hypothetical protein [Plantactinospora sp. WMMB782]|uniref:hypothetical protein n=1 Tax=Plantactinospora sp. WMMB782 TaxID=3404121 RepID=UPI003B961608
MAGPIRVWAPDGGEHAGRVLIEWNGTTIAILSPGEADDLADDIHDAMEYAKWPDQRAEG